VVDLEKSNYIHDLRSLGPAVLYCPITLCLADGVWIYENDKIMRFFTKVGGGGW